jgi:hypothetical protein
MKTDVFDDRIENGQTRSKTTLTARNISEFTKEVVLI